MPQNDMKMFRDMKTTTLFTSEKDLFADKQAESIKTMMVNDEFNDNYKVSDYNKITVEQTIAELKQVLASKIKGDSFFVHEANIDAMDLKTPDKIKMLKPSFSERKSRKAFYKEQLLKIEKMEKDDTVTLEALKTIETDLLTEEGYEKDDDTMLQTETKYEYFEKQEQTNKLWNEYATKYKDYNARRKELEETNLSNRSKFLGMKKYFTKLDLKTCTTEEIRVALKKLDEFDSINSYTALNLQRRKRGIKDLKVLCDTKYNIKDPNLRDSKTLTKITNLILKDCFNYTSLFAKSNLQNQLKHKLNDETEYKKFKEFIDAYGNMDKLKEFAKDAEGLLRLLSALSSINFHLGIKDGFWNNLSFGDL